jgi:predicted amidohydrolase YtcJ
MSDSTNERPLSRRKFLVGGAAASAAAGVGGAFGLARAAAAPSVHVADAKPDVDLALINGRIHTMGGSDSVVSEVLIENGRFVQVGNPKDRPGKDKRDKRVKDAVTIDLKGRVVVPGIVDNHNHIVLMGNRPGYHTPLENAYSIAQVQQTYASRAAQIPAGAWITTIGGFNPNHFAELRLPTLAELDAAAPNNPVYLHIGFNGPGATNTAGKAWFAGRGIAVGAAGSILTASSLANAAMLALRQTLLTPAERKRGSEEAIAYGLSVGVTTHLDQGAFQKTDTPADGAAHEDNYTMHQPFLALHAEGKLNARVQINFLHMESDPNLPGLKERLKNQFQFFGDDVLMTGAIGEFLAQGVGPSFVEAARLVAQAGWRAESHSLSTSDFMSEISAYELANAEFPIGDLRWVVAHVPFITDEWIGRLKAIGGGISLFGASRYLTGSAASNGPRYRAILDSGIHCGMSCDGMQVAPLNPWLGMYYATTGRNARGQLINDGNQITRQEVLRLYTEANGWFLRMEDRVGSIEEGKLADLVVLDRDYFTVPDDDLKKIRSALTLVGGEVVHSDGTFV